MIGVEFMPQTNELLESREQFFRENISLSTHKVFCGDERLALLDAVYIHVFGAVANPAYNVEVLARTRDDIELATDFAEAVTDAATTLNVDGQSLGVHSDTHSEKGNHIDPNGDDPLGCGYIKLRRAISTLIASDPDKIVAKAEQLRPELFTDPSDTHFGHEVVRSHASLAADDTFFGKSSRAVARGAMENGSPDMLVDGSHVSHAGIINLIPHSTFDSNEAFKNGVSTYVEDSWASHELLAQMPKAKKFDSRQREIAELIDTIGTMWALDVEDIERRG